MATTEQMALEYYNKGMDCFVGNMVQHGIENLKMALTFYKELEDYQNVVKTLYGLSLGYGLLQYNTNMVNVILEGLNTCDKYEIKGGKHLFYCVICDTYQRLKDFDSAINYGLMAVQDIEENGTIYENKDALFIVIYLNTAIGYLETKQYKQSEEYIKKAEAVAKDHDIHNHDFTVKVMTARIQYESGNKSYVDENIKDLMQFVKNVNVTLEDYVQDLTILVDLFIRMQDFDNALQVAKSLECSAVSNSNSKIKLETSILYMRIYKAMGDTEGYRDACVRYAEDDRTIQDARSEQLLLEMDTDIALSIAATPLDMI